MIRTPQEVTNISPDWGTHLVDLMLKLGYKINKNGCCYGLAAALSEANLSGSAAVEQFKQTLSYLCQVDTEQMLVYKESLSPDQLLQLNNAKGLLDTIALYFKARNYPELFREGTTFQDQSEQLILANRLIVQDKKEKMTPVYSALDVFEQAELLTQIQSLMSSAAAMNASGESIPVSILVGSMSHEISIAYDPVKKSWIGIDLNQLNPDETHPIVELSDPNEICMYIWQSFKDKIGENEHRVVLDFVVLAQKKHQSYVFNAFNQWHQDIQITDQTFDTLAVLELRYMLIQMARENYLTEAKALMKYMTTHPAAQLLMDMTGLEANKPLIYACLNANIEMIKLLIANGADPAVPAGAYKSAWAAAISRNQPEVINVLLQYSPSRPNFKALALQPPLLQFCVMNRRKDLVEKLMYFVKKNEININEKTSDGTALHIAAANGQIEIVAILLAHGADPNIKDKQGMTAFDIARQRALEFPVDSQKRAAYADIMRVIAKNPNPDINPNAPEKSIHFREMGIDKQNAQGNTALMLAVLAKDASKVCELIAAGADMTIKNHEGMNIVDILEGGDYSLDEDNRLRVYQAIFDNVGSRIQLPLELFSQMLFAFLRDAKNEFLSAALLLCHQEMNILNAPNEKGQNLLHVALGRCDAAKAYMLIKAGIDLNAQTPSGNTPLMAILLMGSPALAKHLKADEVHELVEACLQRNPDLSLANNTGQTVASIVKNLYPYDTQLKLKLDCHDKKEAPHSDPRVKPSTPKI